MRNRIKTGLFLFIIQSFVFCHLRADVEFPLIQSVGYIPFSDNENLQKNDFSFFLDLYYSNVYMFNHTMDTVNDMEILNNTIGFRYGLNKTITVELYYRFLLVYGGFLDSVAEAAHDIFGFKNDGRKVLPKNSVHYKFKHYFLYQEAMVTHSPLVAALLWRFLRLGNFVFRVRAAMGIPLSSRPGFNNDSPFFLAGFICTFGRPEHFFLELSNHLTFFNQPDWLGNEDLRNSFLLSQFRIGFKRVFGGFLLKTSPFKVGDLANNAWQFFLGYKISKTIEISLAEEFAPMDTTPDVTFNIKIRIK